MGDRNEYMKLYMRDYRAAKKAAGQLPTRSTAAGSIESRGPAAAGHIHQAPASLPEGSGPAAVNTEPGQGSGYKWAWWLLAGVMIGFLAYGLVSLARSNPEGSGPAAVNTEPGQEEESEENTEPGQE